VSLSRGYFLPLLGGLCALCDLFCYFAALFVLCCGDCCTEHGPLIYGTKFMVLCLAFFLVGGCRTIHSLCGAWSFDLWQQVYGSMPSIFLSGGYRTVQVLGW
jgi:hypothetical protein